MPTLKTRFRTIDEIAKFSRNTKLYFDSSKYFKARYSDDLFAGGNIFVESTKMHYSQPRTYRVNYITHDGRVKKGDVKYTYLYQAKKAAEERSQELKQFGFYKVLYPRSKKVYAMSLTKSEALEIIKDERMKNYPVVKMVKFEGKKIYR